MYVARPTSGAYGASPLTPFHFWKFSKLTKLIKENNELYNKINLEVHDAETNKEDENTIDELKHQRWQLIHDYATINELKHQRCQLIHDYATAVSDFLLMNMLELEKNDLTALDLVPYTVWKKVPEKTIIIIDAIHNMK